MFIKGTQIKMKMYLSITRLEEGALQWPLLPLHEAASLRLCLSTMERKAKESTTREARVVLYHCARARARASTQQARVLA